MPTDKELSTIKQLLDLAENNIRQAKTLLFSRELSHKVEEFQGEKVDNIIEGIFDGEGMIGPDKKRYDVPANYASKSKLVAGDVLKLTVQNDGTYLYKQICPVRRRKKIGILEELSEGKHVVNCESNQYRVLSASISYFKAKSGDKLTILIPEDQPSEWAAVENLYESIS
jgi:antitoxin component of MazEF toxin-antitoxin module